MQSLRVAGHNALTTKPS